MTAPLQKAAVFFDDFSALIRQAGPGAKCDYINRTWLDFTGRLPEEELGDGF